MKIITKKNIAIILITPFIGLALSGLYTLYLPVIYKVKYILEVPSLTSSMKSNYFDISFQNPEIQETIIYLARKNLLIDNSKSCKQYSDIFINSEYKFNKFLEVEVVGVNKDNMINCADAYKKYITETFEEVKKKAIQEDYANLSQLDQISKLPNKNYSFDIPLNFIISQINLRIQELKTKNVLTIKEYVFSEIYPPITSYLLAGFILGLMVGLALIEFLNRRFK